MEAHSQGITKFMHSPDERLSNIAHPMLGAESSAFVLIEGFEHSSWRSTRCGSNAGF
jgi:hypothetical protein